MDSTVEKKTVVEPTENRILVEPVEAASMTKGGLFLPDQAKEKPAQGTVVAVGPGKRLESGDLAPMDLRVGDMVIYSKYAGTDLTVNEKNMILLRDSDVLAKVSEE